MLARMTSSLSRTLSLLAPLALVFACRGANDSHAAEDSSGAAAASTGVTGREELVPPCEGCEAVFDGLPATLGPATRIAPVDEPGEPLRIQGVVRDELGRAVEGVIVYAYHADA